MNTVATRAGVSESAFFEAFSTAEECYSAAFEEGLERLSRSVNDAAGRETSWLDRLRTGVVAFLGFLDDEPAWGHLLLLQTPLEDRPLSLRVQQRVAEVLTSLLDTGGSQAAEELMPEPTLTSEFVAGGAVSVIQAQMLKRDGAVLVGLAPSLMSFIVRPYLGQVAANAELNGKPSVGEHRPGGESVRSRRAELSRGATLPIRVTHRTTMVLRAIAQAPYSTNREIAEAAGLTDEGQTSKLLGRLERQGVIENVGIGAVRGEPNAWLLTPEGRRVVGLLRESFVERVPRRASGRTSGAV